VTFTHTHTHPLDALTLVVVLEREHDLGGTVPTGGDVLGHEGAIVIAVVAWLGKAACETKVANLELAVSVDEQVSGLEVAVEDLF